MRIFVKVKPKARVEKIEKVDNTHYVVYTKETPEKGKANEGVIRLLSKYFSISKSRIIITSGKTSRSKIITLNI